MRLDQEGWEATSLVYAGEYRLLGLVRRRRDTDTGQPLSGRCRQHFTTGGAMQVRDVKIHTLW